MKMFLPWKLLILLSLKDCVTERIFQHGPVFTQEPSDSIFPLGSGDDKIFLNCKAKGSPSPRYQWRFNGRALQVDGAGSYSLVEGNLLLRNPEALRHGGVYQCIASNAVGTVLSRPARVQFAYLQNFSSRARTPVSVREGQAVVLLCRPPPHFGEVRFSWVCAGQSGALVGDRRRFVSQRTGNLYIAKVERSDAGNYTCVVQHARTNSTAYSSPTSVLLRTDAVMGEYEPKIEVQFEETLHAAKGSSLQLECFALGNPVPSISWRRADGSPLPGKMKINQSYGVLEIPYFRPEDAGVYECMAENSGGRSTARGQLIFNNVEQLHWLQTPRDTHTAIHSHLEWECRAAGQPRAQYRWLKDGAPLHTQGRLSIDGGLLLMSNVSLLDSGMYQCVAQNQHGVLYTSAELRVVASPPDFSRTPVRKSTLIQRGGEVAIECHPHASPRASFTWRRGSELLKDDRRRTISVDGTLRFTNVSGSDAGRYTCVAQNSFGSASSSGFLVVKEPTQITVPPLSTDGRVGQSVVLPCEVSRDPSLEPTFKWFFNGKLLDFSRRDHFHLIGGGSAGDLMIRNIQLRHSGKYVCMVHTAVDSVSAAADLVVRGPPGPPDAVRVGEVTPSSVALSWSPGPDHHSPISHYSLQARSAYSIGWQPARTVPAVVSGEVLRAVTTGLSPWVEYEFRVVAWNAVGLGEPSAPSKPVRTSFTVPEVAPSDVSGGGGSRGELIIVWEPVAEELQSGPGFGYVVAFRPVGTSTWIQTVVASAEASRYVFKNESIAPLTPYQVRVGVYNNVGEGPFSPVVIIHSAEEEPSASPAHVWGRAVSASQVELLWDASKGRVTGYQVTWWEAGTPEIHAQRLKVTDQMATLSGLKGSTLYHVTVRAVNSAGAGPSSPWINITTRKPPPKQAPANIEWNLSNSKIILNWEQVKAMDNESEVTGYKVVYRWNRQSSVVETNRTFVELQLPVGDEYMIQIHTISGGGDGSFSMPIRIPKMASLNSVGSAGSDGRRTGLCGMLLLLSWLVL